MDDLALTLVYAIALLFLDIYLSSVIVGGHTDVRLPGLLKVGSEGRKLGRRALLLEIPFSVVLLGGGAVILVLFLVDPDSTIQVRFVSAAALVASAVWFAYLARKIVRRG